MSSPCFTVSQVQSLPLSSLKILTLALDPSVFLAAPTFPDALLQIPLGFMLDQLGPRIVVGVFPLIGGLGAFLFALGESFMAVF
jgi:nitrate/nitrite transporter NarK